MDNSPEFIKGLIEAKEAPHEITAAHVATKIVIARGVRHASAKELADDWVTLYKAIAKALYESQPQIVQAAGTIMVSGEQVKAEVKRVFDEL